MLDFGVIPATEYLEHHLCRAVGMEDGQLEYRNVDVSS